MCSVSCFWGKFENQSCKHTIQSSGNARLCHFSPSCFILACMSSNSALWPTKKVASKHGKNRQCGALKQPWLAHSCSTLHEWQPVDLCVRWCCSSLWKCVCDFCCGCWDALFSWSCVTTTWWWRCLLALFLSCIRWTRLTFLSRFEWMESKNVMIHHVCVSTINRFLSLPMRDSQRSKHGSFPWISPRNKTSARIMTTASFTRPQKIWLFVWFVVWLTKLDWRHHHERRPRQGWFM